MAEVTVIGGGLAGCEAAWQLAEAGFSVRLLEMKPVQYTPAHRYEGLAELVCSNSLKADRINSAAGLLKAEMTRLGSLLMRCARKSAVAAGGALAAYISSAPTENFQPMGANMGILPDLPERIRGKQEKYQAYADRGMAALEQYLRDAEQ